MRICDISELGFELGFEYVIYIYNFYLSSS